MISDTKTDRNVKLHVIQLYPIYQKRISVHTCMLFHSAIKICGMCESMGITTWHQEHRQQNYLTGIICYILDDSGTTHPSVLLSLGSHLQQFIEIE